MSRFAKFVPVIAIFGTVTAISAAPDTATTPTPAPAPAPAATMSVGEMKVKSEGIRVKVDEDVRYVLHLKELAKKKKDVIKLNCVNDRLVELKAQQNLGDTAHAQLDAALDRGSEDRFGFYGDLERIGQQISSLREQANACIGEPELFKQESGVLVERPEIPDDPTINPFQPEGYVEVEPPGYASPFD